MISRVAIVQVEGEADLGAALDRTERFVREAAGRGAALVVFPESWIPGYPAWLDVCRDVALWDHPPVKRVFARMAANSVTVRGRGGVELSEIARAAGVTMVVGVTECVEQGAGRGTLYNALLTFAADGTLLNHHRKLVPTYTERMVWGPGDADGLRVVASPAGAVGGLICWEHWMPLARQTLHEAGEDIHVAVWPTAHDVHQLASRHYAFEGRCYVLAVGGLMRASALPPELEPHPDRVRTPDQWVLRGGSSVIAPDGSYVCAPLYEEAGIITAELDLTRLREESMTLDVAGHYQRPDCFEFHARTSGRLTSDARA